MNIHKNARLTLVRRLEMVRDMTERGFTPSVAALTHGVSLPTARKWLGRFLAQGEAGLADRSSRPAVSPRAISPSTALAIVELRHRRLTQARIAKSLGVSESTVSRVLSRAGLSKLSDLVPAEPVQRYEHAHPGDLIHIDTKKLGRIRRQGKRIPGSPYSSVGAGWETLFVAVDDHSRASFTDLYPDECRPSAIQFLENSVAYYKELGVRVRQLLTDNGSAFRSKSFAAACERLEASSIGSPGPTGHRPMAKLSASFNQRSESGPTPSHTTTPSSAQKCSINGFITTTGTAPTRASEDSHQCPDSQSQLTTS